MDINVTHDQTVHLLNLPVGKFVNVSMAVRALHVTVRAVKVEVFRHIEKPEGLFLILLIAYIAEAPVLMAKETVLFIHGLHFRITKEQEKKHCR